MEWVIKYINKTYNNILSFKPLFIPNKFNYLYIYDQKKIFQLIYILYYLMDCCNFLNLIFYKGGNIKEKIVFAF